MECLLLNIICVVKRELCVVVVFRLYQAVHMADVIVKMVKLLFEAV